ncbi:MAG: glycosyltransferase family 2 protein [Bacteroidia bacterium]|nr:glycosyltransferase family 2 protein [Bacteroidia bacterium]
MKKILVAILNWNGKHYLEKFLPDIILRSEEADILIIDNASTDGSAGFVRDKFPNVKIKVLDKNYGFAGGYNKGLEGEDYPYYVLLNNDVEVSEGWLLPMVKWMEEHPQTGALQPKLLQYDRRSYFEYSGACGGHLDKWGFPFCRGRVFDTLEEDRGQYDEPGKIFWACGAAMMVRAEAFKKAGGFDDRFFAHMEEIDLCWRLRQMGYDIYNCSASVVYHVGGGTLKTQSVRKYYLNFRNSLYCLVKNHPKNTWSIILIRLMLDGLASLYFLIKGNFKVMMGVLQAHAVFYIHLPALIKYRLNRKKILSSYMDVYPDYEGSIVLKYYFLRKNTYEQLNKK